MIIAATATQNIGIAIAVVAVVAWLAYVLANTAGARKEVGAEVELAPNRQPGMPDDELEGRKLDRSLATGLGALVILGVGLPLYWLAEPGRQEGAITNFDAQAVSRGEQTYLPSTEGPNSFGCQECHGPEGVGGVAPFALEDPVTGEVRQVQWAAPALNTVLLKFDEEEVADIIAFGRPNTPMPAWGVEGGGPMNEQQVQHLVAYLASIQLSPEEAAEEVAAEAQNLLAQGRAGSMGEALFMSVCARCHTQGYTYGDPGVMGGGAFGPSLVDGATLRQFPAVEDHLEFVITGSDAHVAYGERGVGSGRMPGFGFLTDAQLEAIVEYERGL